MISTIFSNHTEKEKVATCKAYCSLKYAEEILEQLESGLTLIPSNSSVLKKTQTLETDNPLYTSSYSRSWILALFWNYKSFPKRSKGAKHHFESNNSRLIQKQNSCIISTLCQ